MSAFIEGKTTMSASLTVRPRDALRIGAWLIVMAFICAFRREWVTVEWDE